MKTWLVTGVVCMSLFAGCGTKAVVGTSTGSASLSAAPASAISASAEEMAVSSVTEAPEVVSESTIRVVMGAMDVYPASEGITAIGMGVEENGEKKELCKVNAPVNYFYQTKTEDNENEKLPRVSDAIATKGKLDEITDTLILMDLPHGSDRTYFSIKQGDSFSIDAEKEKHPGGYEMTDDPVHQAYAYLIQDEEDAAGSAEEPSESVMSGDEDAVLHLIYELDEKHTLRIEWTVVDPDSFQPKKAAQSLYDLVHPEV